MTVGQINTYQDIQAILDRLEQEGSASDVNVVQTIDESLQLGAVLAQSWEYAGPNAANYTMDAMKSAGKNDGHAAPPIPDSNQTDPTSLEAKLIASYEDWCSEVYETFKRFNGVMHSRLRRLKSVIQQMKGARERDPDDPASNFYSEQIVASFPTQTFVQEVRDRFEGPFTMFLEKRNLFQAFRTAHGLHRNPKYEASMLAFLFIATICIVVETAVNGFMYGQASEMGLIGGWGVAAGLSIVIFSSSFVAGLVLTHKNGMGQINPPPLDDSDRRPLPTWTRSFVSPLRGWSGWAGLSALILVLIAFVCVYRDEAATFDPSSGIHPMAEAINRVRTLDLLPRADIEGLLLIFVNLAIMIVGMYKGYTHFDTVPHYKSHAEELARARQELEAKIEEAKQELGLSETQFDDRLRPYSQTEVDNLVHRHKDGVAALDQLQDSCDVQISNTARECNERLTAYRSANKDARPAPLPPPTYFNQRWEPPPKPRLESGVEPVGHIDTSAIADALEQHRSAALKILSRRAQERYSKEISKYVKESEIYRHEVNQKEH